MDSEKIYKKLGEATETIAEYAILEAIAGCMRITSHFVDQYGKHRNVGFSMLSSMGGAWEDTTSYVSDKFHGIEHKEKQQAIFFDND